MSEAGNAAATPQPAIAANAGEISGFLARAAISAILALSRVNVAICRGFWRIFSGRRAGDPQTWLLAGSFYNEGWFDSHVTPLCVADQIRRVLVVTDTPLTPRAKVEYICPPKWVQRTLTRAGARLLWTGVATWRRRAGVLMGYHIMPNALLCLNIAALLNRRAIYQMTGGPVQLIGGGYGSENALLRRQGRPSVRREQSMFALLRRFDLVAVRGDDATAFVRTHAPHTPTRIIPGSVDPARFRPADAAQPPDYDVLTVGRLVPVKRYDRLVAIAAASRALGRPLRIGFIGDGPLAEALRTQAAALGVAEQVTFFGKQRDVPAFLRRGRAFALTSETEGLSIAMIEALCAGLPVFAPPVGETGLLLKPGVTGAWLPLDDAAAAARTIIEFLDDEPHMKAAAQAARAAAAALSSPDAIAAQWNEVVQNWRGAAAE